MRARFVSSILVALAVFATPSAYADDEMGGFGGENEAVNDSFHESIRDDEDLGGEMTVHDSFHDEVAAAELSSDAVGSVRSDPFEGTASGEPRPERSPSNWRLGMGLGTTISFGTSPDKSNGFGAHLYFAYKAFQIHLGGRYELGAKTAFGDGGTATVRLGGADLAICGEYLSLFACGVGFIGSQYVGASSPAGENSIDTLSIAAGARVGYEALFDPNWSARIVIDGLVPTTRTSYWVGNTMAWRTPIMMAAISVYAMWSFP